jgi:hypothetical protein
MVVCSQFCEFIESPDGDLPNEMLELTFDTWDDAKAYPERQAFDIFSEFVSAGKTNTEAFVKISVPDELD